MSYDEDDRLLEWVMIAYGMIVLVGSLLAFGVIVWAVWKIVT